MVLGLGVLETQEGSEVDALEELGLSALKPVQTSATHMVSWIPSTDDRYENLIIPFQFKEPLNPLFHRISNRRRY